MSHHDSRLNGAANGDDLALADAISLITGDIAAVADLITTGHEDAADNTVPTSAILIGQLARELGDAAIEWADTKRGQAQTLTQDAKTAQAAARIAEILEGAQRDDDAKGQATASDDTTEQAEEHQETQPERDMEVVRKVRALELCIMRLSSIFTQVIPIAKGDSINDDPDGFMMLLEKGQEAAELAFYIVCNAPNDPLGIDRSMTEEEQEEHDAGGLHPDLKAFDTVRAEFLEMMHTPRQEQTEA